MTDVLEHPTTGAQYSCKECSGEGMVPTSTKRTLLGLPIGGVIFLVIIGIAIPFLRTYVTEYSSYIAPVLLIIGLTAWWWPNDDTYRICTACSDQSKIPEG